MISISWMIFSYFSPFIHSRPAPTTLNSIFPFNFINNSIIPTELTFIELDYGTFIGTITDDIKSFKNIPFAQPPIGSLRFKPPQPPIYYNDFQNAIDYGKSCYQPSSNSWIQLTGVGQDRISEDCLNLNVWIPNNNELVPLLPVMVWIFGGAFNHGSANVDL